MSTTQKSYTEALPHIAGSKHVLLTTFRKNGNPVATPVGTLVDNGTVYVLTDPTTGKVKRIRNSSQVTIAPCTMSGAIPQGAPTVSSTAQLLDGPQTSRVQNLMKRRFVMYRLVGLLDRALRRQRPLVAIAITAT
ncbi:PPOX class F420-dependent oxidoreductase [Streptomyces sp. NPDC051913]|uniref:PPOX class F420-dependent oxidoreductase n=1 Tax=Streptomyces sp. NPDC051913 TaxID=3365676 RepID=UPI0037D8691D